MKPTAAALVLFSFLGLAVFGAFVMYHSGSHDARSGGCWGAMLQGTECPWSGGWGLSVAFHATAFKSFSTAAFGAHILGFLSVAALVLGTGRAPAPPTLAASRRRFPRVNSTVPRQALTGWLALHEQSPGV